MALQVPLQRGDVFSGRYEVVRAIASGGMGTVYEVLHLETRRRRAMKVMQPSIVADPGLRARFKLEATVTAEIDSEHIVETFDAGIDAVTGAPFLVMELLKGDDLAAYIEKQRRVPATDVVKLMTQVAHALEKTHAAGIVHRDLKPENFFITYRDDGSMRLKLLDFGIAKVIAQSNRRRTTEGVGTPLYMAPEQLDDTSLIDHRTDLYALGHVVYAMLVGHPYWEEEEAAAKGIHALLLTVMRGPQELASVRARRRGLKLRPGFDAWFAKATAIKPADRFERAADLVTALAHACGLSPEPPSEDPLFEPTELLGVAGHSGNDRRDRVSNDGTRRARKPSDRKPFRRQLFGSVASSSSNRNHQHDISAGARPARRTVRRTMALTTACVAMIAVAVLAIRWQGASKPPSAGSVDLDRATAIVPGFEVLPVPPIGTATTVPTPTPTPAPTPTAIVGPTVTTARTIRPPRPMPSRAAPQQEASIEPQSPTRDAPSASAPPAPPADRPATPKTSPHAPTSHATQFKKEEEILDDRR